MVKQLIPALAFIVVLSSCTTFKSLNLTNNRPAAAVTAPASSQSKFIDDISITAQPAVETQVKPIVKQVPATHDRNTEEVVVAKEEPKTPANFVANRSAEVESASPVQLKYAVLLNTEVEYLPNKVLLENVDEWYGVRYRTGGNTKGGVDCSGFTVAVYSAVYGIALP